MGCSGSRSLQTLPVSRSAPSFDAVENDDWMVYAPAHNTCFQCGQSCTEDHYDDSTSSRSYLSSAQQKSNRSQWLGSRSCSRSVQSTPPFTSSSYTTSNPISIPISPGTPRSSPGAWVGNSTSSSDCSVTDSVLSTPTFHSPSSHPRNGPTIDPPSTSGSDCGSATNRTYSVLSTPTFHSPSSHPRNGLTLDPTLFSNNIISPDDRGNGLTLDPTLFSSTISYGLRDTKIDTDCASRFSGASRSPSFSFSSSISSYSRDKRYPLTPLSVRTEPFPRETQQKVLGSNINQKQERA